mmetsp:Transcript_80290/g.245401  ORF Transcript_80290/g.245401 Transcript_80290/m.245401 type:complete len:558 (-) Transcript_80290:559-2232(-)
MGAALDDTAFVDDCDLARVYHRREAVGDQDDRAPRLLDQLVQGLLHQRLVLGVQRRCGLVQEEEPRLPQEAARDGEALPLTPGKEHPPLAHARVVLLLCIHDELVRVRRLARLDDLLVAVRPAQAVREVFLDRLREQLGVLRHEAAQRAHGPRGQLPHVPAVQQQLALSRLVEAHEEMDERALAAAAFAHEGRRGAGNHVQVDAFQDHVLGTRLVAELHALQRQLPAHGVPLDAVPGVGVHLGARVDEGDHALGRRGRADQVVEHVAQRDEGIVHHVPIQLVRDQHANAHLLTHRRADLRTAVPQDEDSGAQVQVRRESTYRRAHVRVLLAMREGDTDALLVLLGLQLFCREATHCPDIMDSLCRATVGLPVRAIYRAVNLSAPLRVLAVDVCNGGHDRQRQHRQLPRGLERHHHAPEEKHQIRDKVVQQNIQRLDHLACVISQTRRDLPSVHGVEERNVHTHDALEKLRPDAASQLAQHQFLCKRFQSAEGALESVNEEVHHHCALETTLPFARVFQILEDAIEDHPCNVRRPNLHRLGADEAHHSERGDVSKLQG